MRAAMIGEPGGVEDAVDRLQRRRVFASEQRGAHAARRLGREQQIVFDRVVLEHGRLLELAADPERRNLGFVELGQIMAPVEHHLALSGRVLPVMMSIIVVLPAPLGPMIARISPGWSISDRLRNAL